MNIDAIETGIVVPTLGTRPEYLEQCLLSIRDAGGAFINIVTPSFDALAAQLNPSLYDVITSDPGGGLSNAINVGIRTLPEHLQFVNWLGDDDLLIPNAIALATSTLRQNPRTVLVYGGCRYINGNGDLLWINKSGSYAKFLMRCGPQLIPQPGALFRRSTFEQIGGLQAQYKWAFDLDMLIRLSRFGNLQYIHQTLASFRWHEGSLSVGGREGSVREASDIRVAALPRSLRSISPLWEKPLRRILLKAGNRVTRRNEQKLA